MIKAIGKRLIVQLVEVERKSMILQVDERKQWQTGRVMSVGDDVPIFEGHFVWFRSHSGLIVGYDGQEYISLDISEILGVSEVLA